MLTSQTFTALDTSPAFVLDLDQVTDNARYLQRLQQASGCKVLYAIKALPLTALMTHVQPYLDGFAVSSLFEAKLAAQVLAGQGGSIHLTTPGLRVDEFSEISQLCSHISFNSLSQQQRLLQKTTSYSPGLRINPKCSYLTDSRYDPCRLHSKLGVDITMLQQQWPAEIVGIHLHTLFGSLSFQPLIETVQSLLPILAHHGRLAWINMGGGYLYPQISSQTALIQLIQQLLADYADHVYIEPGKALVGNAGYLCCTVLDSFVSDGKPVLILDSSVNHHPEIFEYQRKPELFQGEPAQGYSAILAGSSCLAGDLFGEYRFSTLPVPGDKLVFANLGAYSLIKANRFNGYNFPDIYLSKAGQLQRIKQYSYADYQQQWRS